MSINRTIVSGNLTRDAECKRTQSGMAIVTFGVAVNERRKNNQTGEWDDYPNYFDVTWFGTYAEKCSGSLVKGSKITVDGHLRQERWEKDGQNRSKVCIIADTVDMPPKPKGQYTAPDDVTMYSDDIPF